MNIKASLSEFVFINFPDHRIAVFLNITKGSDKIRSSCVILFITSGGGSIGSCGSGGSTGLSLHDTSRMTIAEIQNKRHMCYPPVVNGINCNKWIGYNKSIIDDSKVSIRC